MDYQERFRRDMKRWRERSFSDVLMRVNLAMEALGDANSVAIEVRRQIDAREMRAVNMTFQWQSWMIELEDEVKRLRLLRA